MSQPWRPLASNAEFFEHSFVTPCAPIVSTSPAIKRGWGRVEPWVAGPQHSGFMRQMNTVARTGVRIEALAGSLRHASRISQSEAS